MSTTVNTPQAGDLRVWWIPQRGTKEMFYVPVSGTEEGIKIIATLARYDMFQSNSRVVPDLTLVSGLERYDAVRWAGVA